MLIRNKKIRICYFKDPLNFQIKRKNTDKNKKKKKKMKKR